MEKQEQQIGKDKFRNFFEARAYVYALQVNNVKQWQEWAKSGERPNDIPFKPEEHYKNNGWTDWSDWLGTTHENENGAVKT